MAQPSSRFAPRAETATYFQVSESTIENWHERGYIAAYRSGSRTLLYNLDEIEAKLRAMPRSKMRDGRSRRMGRIVALPIPMPEGEGNA